MRVPEAPLARMTRAPRITSIILVIALVLALLPLAWTLLAAFGVQPRAGTPPTWSMMPTLEGFAQIRNEQTYFWGQMLNSIGVSLATTGCALTAGFLAAYSLAHMRGKRREWIAQMLLILACLPVITYIIPLREVLRALRLHDTFLGLLWAQSALSTPLVAYILYGYLASDSPDLEEAARLDGATPAQCMGRVTLPVHGQGILAVGVIVFILTYNQFIMPLMLTSTQVRIMPVSMRDFFSLEREFEWRTGAAVIVVTLLPALIAVGLAHQALNHFALPSSLTD